MEPTSGSTLDVSGRGAILGLNVGGIFALLILIADLGAIVRILQGSAAPGNKTLWIVMVLVLPILGLVIWFLLGPRPART